MSREDCAPELAGAVFGHAGLRVWPTLVHTRFGLHVVEILARQNAIDPTYEEVHGAVEALLIRHAFAAAQSQYVWQLSPPSRAD